MKRRNKNIGNFTGLEIPMQKRAVAQICREYGVDISGLMIKIQHSEELLPLNIAGAASPEQVGRIDLLPNAFKDKEQLLRTVIHEGAHVKQFHKYGIKDVQNRRLYMEKVAERYEEFFYNLLKRRSRK